MIDHSGAMQSFLRQAGKAFQASTGLQLSQARPEVELLRDDMRATRAMPARVAPEAYAAGLVRLCGFRTDPGAEAREFNGRFLALLAHAAEDPGAGWTLGGDGAIYAEAGDALVRVSPSSDEWGGFDVHRLRAEPTGVHGKAPGGGIPEEVGRGLDLDEAVGLAGAEDRARLAA